MQSEGNKAVVSRYFLEGLNGLNPDVIDEVFDPDHVLSSPDLPEEVRGTQMIKDMFEEFRSATDGVTCTVESQIEEGEWVATSYTLKEQEDHEGIMISRVVDGKITESQVVAKTVSGPQAERTVAPGSATTLRHAFN